MLTPEKIKEKSFQTTGRGSYRAEDVDSFLSEVSASYEQMFRENGDLIKKISILAKKVEEYRADEESLKMALLNAQKLADKITAEAKENAEKELADAKAETEKLIADAKAEVEEITSVINADKDAIIDAAKAEAEKILADANRQSNEILGNINRKVTHESLVYEMLQKEASEFKSKLVAMYKEHINLINQLPEIADNEIDEATEEAPAVEEAIEETVEEEIVVIEEEPAFEVIEETEEIEVIEDETPEVEEEIEEVEIEIIEETPVEEVAEGTVEEAVVEEIPAEPVVKKSFKLDLSKIDFADDYDEAEEPAPAPTIPVEEEIVEETVEEDDDAPKSISFKNFFKKK